MANPSGSEYGGNNRSHEDTTFKSQMEMVSSIIFVEFKSLKEMLSSIFSTKCFAPIVSLENSVDDIIRIVWNVSRRQHLTT